MCMLRIGGRLTVAASAALALSLLILLTLNSPAPPSSSGAEPVTGGQMLGTQAITTDELARQVKAGEISSIVVLGGHAVATTVDSHPFTFTVVRGVSVLQQLQSLGVTPDELSRVDYVAGQPPLEGAPGTVPIIGVPLVLFGALALYVWRSSTHGVASLSQHSAHLHSVRSNEQSKRRAKQTA
jgi:hypothetical protein